MSTYTIRDKTFTQKLSEKSCIFTKQIAFDISHSYDDLAVVCSYVFMFSWKMLHLLIDWL